MPPARRGTETLRFFPFKESVATFQFNFVHPFAQALFMFTAESLCLLVLWAQCRCRGSVPQSKPHHPLVYLVPAASDFFASVIQNIGLFLTYASVYQMLRGATVVWIAVFSYFVFGRHYRKIEKWGVGIVMLGLTLVGLSSVYSGRGGASAARQYPHQMWGNLLIVAAQVLHAIQGVAEERLMVLYDLPPLQVVGMEGIFGVSLSLMLLALLQLFPVARWGSNVSGLEVVESFQNSATPRTTEWSRSNTTALLGLLETTNSTNYFPLVPYDDVHLVLSQMASSWACLLCVALYISSGLVYNVAQISIIKLLSAAATVMLGSLRNISVWLVCLVLPFFNESLNPIQMLGFCLLIIGNVLFQRIVFGSWEECLPECILHHCPLLFADRHLAADSPPASNDRTPAAAENQDPDDKLTHTKIDIHHETDDSTETDGSDLPINAGRLGVRRQPSSMPSGLAVPFTSMEVRRSRGLHPQLEKNS
eukprot:gene4961-3559_t